MSPVNYDISKLGTDSRGSVPPRSPSVRVDVRVSGAPAGGWRGAARSGGARQVPGQLHGERERTYHHSSPHACQRPRVNSGPLLGPVTRLWVGRRARGAVKPLGVVAAGAGRGVLPIKLFSVRSCEVRASRGARGRLVSLAHGVSAGRGRRTQTSVRPTCHPTLPSGLSARNPRATAGGWARAAFSSGAFVFEGRGLRRHGHRRRPRGSGGSGTGGEARGGQPAGRGARRRQARAPGASRDGWPACDGATQPCRGLGG